MSESSKYRNSENTATLANTTLTTTTTPAVVAANFIASTIDPTAAIATSSLPPPTKPQKQHLLQIVNKPHLEPRRCFTAHQPSSEIFDLCNSVMCLRQGQALYQVCNQQIVVEFCEIHIPNYV